jgi:hypothetical protein
MRILGYACRRPNPNPNKRTRNFFVAMLTCQEMYCSLVLNSLLCVQVAVESKEPFPSVFRWFLWYYYSAITSFTYL